MWDGRKRLEEITTLTARHDARIFEVERDVGGFLVRLEAAEKQINAVMPSILETLKNLNKPSCSALETEQRLKILEEDFARLRGILLRKTQTGKETTTREGSFVSKFYSQNKQ